MAAGRPQGQARSAGHSWMLAMLVVASPLTAGWAGATVDGAGALPSARSDMASVWTGRSVYLFGGAESGSSAFDDILRYDPVTGVVTDTGVSLPEAKRHATAVWTGQYAYVFGGDRCCPDWDDDIVRFDPSTGEVRTMEARLPAGRSQLGAAWTGSRVYLLAGAGPGQPVDILEYDPGADTLVTKQARVPSPRSGLDAFWDGRSVFAVGGSDEVLQYDPQRDVVTVVARLPTSRVEMGVVFDGERYAYLFGGGDDRGVLEEILRFDTWTKEVEVLPEALPEPRHYMPAEWVPDHAGGRAFIFGGATSCCSRTATIASFAPEPQDTTPPSLDLAVSCLAPGNPGWCLEPYDYHLEASDVGTGLAPGQPVCRLDQVGAPCAGTLSVEGAHRIDACAEDLAGLRSCLEEALPSLDLAAPALVAARSIAANSWGWNNRPVRVDFACLDEVSGVAQAPLPVRLDAEGDAQRATGTCADLAGHVATASEGPIRIDLTPPRVTADAAPRPNVHGWNNAPVEVAWACVDLLSGVAQVSAPTEVSAEGAVVLPGQCLDRAGNQDTASVGVAIDRTPPAVQLLRPEEGTLYVGDVPYIGPAQIGGLPAPQGGGPVVLGTLTLLASAGDALSGVERVDFSVDGAQRCGREAPPFACDWAAHEESPGWHRVEVVAYDFAGNAAADGIDVLTLLWIGPGLPAPGGNH